MSDLSAEVAARLFGRRTKKRFDNGAHILSYARTVARRVAIDHQRKRGAAMRPSSGRRVPMSAVTPEERIRPREIDWDALGRCLQKLEVEDSELANIVTSKYVVGLTIPETADLLGISEYRVKLRTKAATLWIEGLLPIVVR